MLEKFYPQYRFNSIADIKIDFFKKHHIKNVILDIDNTLVPYTVAKPTDTAVNFINKLRAEGINVCLVSNNNRRRVETFNSDLKLHTRHRAAKPLTRRLRQALDAIHALPSNSAIIGDQLFTDVWCGNRMKMTTILVEPIENKENLFFKFKRNLEKKILKKLDDRR